MMAWLDVDREQQKPDRTSGSRQCWPRTSTPLIRNGTRNG